MYYNILDFLITYIHLFSSFLWWGLTFFVIFILGPVNKKGFYSSILPRIHKFVIPISTLSILSGIVLTLIKQLKKNNKKIGIASLCSGGGQGNAICVEAV